MNETELVRLLIPDVDSTDRIYTDDQINGFLTVADGNKFRAASLAVGALSVDEAITYKVIKTDDESWDGAKVADALRARAKDLEQQANRLDTELQETYFFMTFPQPQTLAPELKTFNGYL